jgi:hypothetical protein
MIIERRTAGDRASACEHAVPALLRNVPMYLSANSLFRPLWSKANHGQWMRGTP